jgi:predicted Zn-dependent protease
MNSIIKQISQISEISDWRLLKLQNTGYQMYVIGDVLDSIRKVVTNKYYLTVYCDHDGMRGDTHLTIFEHEKDSLNHRLKQAVYMAGRVDNPPYRLPGPSAYPFVESFDPTLLGDVEEILFVRLADRLIETVEREKDIRLSSSEFFLDLQNISLQNSRGIDVDYRRSQIFFDGVLFSGQGESEVEMHFEPRARRLQDLPMDRIVRSYANLARDSGRSVLPTSGRYPVVVSGNALSGIFAPIIHHTSAANRFRKTSQFEMGTPIHTTCESGGEPLTLISNGFTPFGLKTSPCDADGLPATRFEVIRDGCFVQPWSTNQYAEYLHLQPTGAIANLEIPIGTTSKQTLLEENGPVLNVVEFSAMMPDLISGNFAAEIKMGYEHRNGQVFPVSGGSVSGNLLTGFGRAFYSTESQFSNYAMSLNEFGTYTGPEAIRFESFQISGR